MLSVSKNDEDAADQAGGEWQCQQGKTITSRNKKKTQINHSDKIKRGSGSFSLDVNVGTALWLLSFSKKSEGSSSGLRTDGWSRLYTKIRKRC